MIKLIIGEKGTGKTKIMIDMMNEAIASTNGSLVCIEKGSNLRTQINYKVRWCDTEFYRVDGFDSFYGFVSGMLAGNYDIEKIFVDGILKIGGRDFDSLGAMLDKLAALTGDATTVVFTVSAAEKDMPESVKKYIG
ncbi:MAG: hypothetical protein PUE12_13725 [Oscillospiraceae bacterium]|nr:hypothetical protein [Oscillospiraceae bacterium]